VCAIMGLDISYFFHFRNRPNRNTNAKSKLAYYSKIHSKIYSKITKTALTLRFIV